VKNRIILQNILVVVMSAVRVSACRRGDWLSAWSDCCRSASTQENRLGDVGEMRRSAVLLVSFSRGREEDGELKAVGLLRKAVPVSCVLIVVIG
jgi:phage baseplate assembly protein gpV